MKKIFLIVLVVLIAAAVSLLIFKDVIVKSVLARGIEAATGTPVTIGAFHFSFGGTVEAKDIKLFNPASFTERLMAEIPVFALAADIKAFMRGNVHLPLLKLDLKELVLVRSKDGKLNVEALMALKPKGQGPAPKVAIDLVEYSIGKVVFKDYQLGLNREFAVNSSDRFADVTDPAAMVKAVLARALKSTSLPKLAGLDMKGLNLELENALLKTRESLSGSLENETGKAVRELKGSLDRLFP